MGSQILKCQMSKTFTLFTVYFRHTIPSDYRCSVRIHKIAGPNPGPLSRRPEMSLSQPSSGWLPFLFCVIGKNEAAKREKLAPYFICFVQDTLGLWPPFPHHCPPSATRLRGTCPAGGEIHGSASHNYSILLCHLFSITDICWMGRKTNYIWLLWTAQKKHESSEYMHIQ